MDELIDETAPDGRAISYEQWGIDFFNEAISEQRVLGAVNTIAGQRIDFGPMGVGPGRIAKVLAYGEIGKATATRVEGDQICYRVLLPVALTFEVDLQIEKQLYKAELLVPLTLTAVAMSGLRIFIETEPPAPRRGAGRARGPGNPRLDAAAGSRRRGRAAPLRRALRRQGVRQARGP